METEKLQVEGSVAADKHTFSSCLIFFVQIRDFRTMKYFLKRRVDLSAQQPCAELRVCKRCNAFLVYYFHTRTSSSHPDRL